MSENFFEEMNLENWKELRREDRFGGEGWVGKAAAGLPHSKKRGGVKPPLQEVSGPSAATDWPY
jgi:hypothetical protein